MASEVENNKSLQDFYQKAKEAFERGNFDYAQALLKNLLLSHPDFQKARSLLRVAQIKKNEGKSISWLKKHLNQIRLAPLRAEVMVLMVRQKWMPAIEVLERMFQLDPCYPFSLRKFSECAAALGWTQAAIDTLEILKKRASADIRTLNALAQLYVKNGNFEKARRHFEEAIHGVPGDPVALKGLKDLAAVKTIEQGGWSDNTDYRQKIRDESGAEILEKGSRLVKSQEDLVLLIQDVRKKLEIQPENTLLLKELVKLLEQNQRWDEAISSCKKLSELLPFDESIQKQVTDLITQKINIEMLDVKNRLSKDQGNTKLALELEDLKRRKKEMTLEDCKKRVEHYPNNLTYRYELGYLYFELGHWNNAIQEFQHAVKDPQRRARALYYLGLCFKESSFFDLAEKQLLKVLDELTDMDNFKKDVIYNLGLVYEATGQLPKALAEYKKIFEVDIAFKDVAQKIQKAYKK